ncbi:Protein involved in plasmid maintenance/nuclear protein involved in lipid metabolism [Phaffia rhodozyma]|uniref:Protein involved in plasmid maintenance/nuclear protein involved in lipid metabolism n=1 Tax=Phaffia rhodozyma TaxID=264483 RepID=A0A0F7SKE0_PHARH|nr:Protein involved in plasmid maintenance/nuclear protein involved in lipid metabolism [Phaffia rhodozyma]
MQYLSRAYQYYSGINPATLSGAIDVIVVEREDESTPSSSSTVLACSPFHVRFGKLQVLRAGEKKVTLTVNSHPVPFFMKVGEAGEAFFVVETDEAVPDDLLTSPLLGATEVNKKPTNTTDLETIVEGVPKHSKTDSIVSLDITNSTEDTSNSERFGVLDDQTTMEDVANAHNEDVVEEPDFLDLNAWTINGTVSDPTSPALYPSPPPSPPLSPTQRTPRAPFAELSPQKPLSPTRSTSQPSVPQSSYSNPSTSSFSYQESKPTNPSSSDFLSASSPSSTSPTKLTGLSVSPSSLLSKASTTAHSIAQAVNTHSQDLTSYVSEIKAEQQLEEAYDSIRHPFGVNREMNREAKSSIGGEGDGQNEGGDDLLPEIKSGQGKPPDVVYGDDVVIDMEGYKGHTENGDEDEPSGLSQDTATQSNLAPLTPSRSSRASTEPPPDVTPSSAASLTASTVPPVSAEQESTKHFVKTLRLSSDQLKLLNLKKGANTITFSVTSSYSGVATCAARIFLWDVSDHIVISDIDGTITKSDALGHLFAAVGRDWTHTGVAKLYTDIVNNGYKIMYLTSRAIGQADSTRDYLKNISQGSYQLPEGPVIMSPDRLMTSLHREVILRKPEVFKMACLRDLQRLFGNSHKNAFYAGFGNRINDALSYRSINIPSSRIFTIDSNGEVKTELLELAGHKSSYIFMNDLVDQMFPSVHAKWTPEFTDFNFWRAPPCDIDLPDLSPPSPALSARSDTSGRLSVLRNLTGSLRGSRSATPVNPPTSPTNTGHKKPDGDHGTNISRPVSPLTGPGWSSDDEYSEDEGQRAGTYRTRRDSMPGSLPNSYEEESYFYSSQRFRGTGDRPAKVKREGREGKEDEGELDGEGEAGEGGEQDEEEENEEEENEEDDDEDEERDDHVEDQVDFDEDLFATGEMGSVPF